MYGLIRLRWERYMNRLIFEGRFLVNMVGSIVRQDELRAVHSRIEWERMYRTADYHRIANITYLGLLGYGGKIPERWQERFFERYQEALKFSDVCEEDEQEILMMMDMMELSCVVLTSCKVRRLYQIPEMAGSSPLRLMFDETNYTLAKGYLVDLGYETDQTYKGYGERMRRISGFCVEIYHKLPFRSCPYTKNMSRILDSAYIRDLCQYVRTLSLENRFVFMISQAAYHYAQDELLIREVLDLYLYHRAWREQMNQEYIDGRVAEFGIDGLAAKLLQLAYMWFGAKEEILPAEQPEDIGVFDILENRILSRGEISHETDRQALRLACLIQRDKEKEARRDRREAFYEACGKLWSAFMRKVRWIFPEYRYMCAVYPFLEKVPVLLPFYWIRRGIRLLKCMVTGKSKKETT